MRETMNNESTTTEPPPYNGQQPKPLGALMHFTGTNFSPLDSGAVKTHKKCLAREVSFTPKYVDLFEKKPKSIKLCGLRVSSQ